jgi:hypothetical protein
MSRIIKTVILVFTPTFLTHLLVFLLTAFLVFVHAATAPKRILAVTQNVSAFATLYVAERAAVYTDRVTHFQFSASSRVKKK